MILQVSVYGLIIIIVNLAIKITLIYTKRVVFQLYKAYVHDYKRIFPP